MSHSPEPWHEHDHPTPNGWQRGFRAIRDADERVVAVAHATTRDGEPLPPGPENAERIVACVNACKDIPTKTLQWAIDGHMAIKVSVMAHGIVDDEGSGFFVVAPTVQGVVDACTKSLRHLWQPIETAPKDGATTPALLAWEGVAGIDIGWLEEGRPSGGADAWFGSHGTAFDPQPTHWMPLPEPPAKENP